MCMHVTQVGMLVDKLAEKGLERSSLFIFTSDNGAHTYTYTYTYTYIYP